VFVAFVFWVIVVSAPPDVPEAVRKAGLPATVRVSDPGSAGTGTGVVIGVRDGDVYILTAAHVVSRGAKVQAETFSPLEPSKVDSTHEGGEVRFRVTDADLAVIRIPAGKREWAVVKLAHESDVKGAWVIGCDDGREPRFTAIALTGKKLVRRPDGTSAFYSQAEGESVAGRSGGPLLDAKGQLIGICSGTQDGKSYFAHPDEIRAALKAHRLAWVLGEKGKE
jgi:S1-C subfamily serine protease